MYEIDEPKPTRNRTTLVVIAAVAVLILSACFFLTVGAVVFGFTGQARINARGERARELVSQLPAQQPTPHAQVVIQSPPDGVDYESAVLRNVYEQVNPSVVNITILMSHPPIGDTSQVPVTPDSSSGDELLPVGSGSGFVWDTNGYIATNYHVVEGAEQVQVTFSDGTMSIAEVVGTDEDSDLAVIKIDPTGYDLTPVRLGKIDDLFVGMRVAAIGNPFGLRGTLTSGIVSAIGRSIPSRGNFSIPDSIQTDAAINPGNSGGPLLNERGEVIGVNAQIRSEVRANSGVGFALPVSILQRVIPSLIETGAYSHSYMGVSGATFSPICAAELGLDPALRGVLVEDALSGGPAARAGLRGPSRRIQTRYPGVCPSEAGGDVITAVNRQPVTTFDDVLVFMDRFSNPGDEITLTILRDGKQQDLKMTLGERPQTNP